MTRASRNASLAVLLFAAIGAPGCGDDESPSPIPEVSYEVDATNLEPLAAGKGHYEAWISFPLPDDDGKRASNPGASPLHGELELVSIGRFLIGEDGHVTALDGDHEPDWALRVPRDLGQAVEAWISIEPEGDQDTIPAGLLLAGEFGGTASRGTATLRANYRTIWDLSLGDLNLAGLAGTLTLETPSDADTTNEARGFYWSVPREGAPTDTSGLSTLPVLDGALLTYESWIERPASGGFVSTGRFTDPDTLDSDGPGAGVSVSANTPRFPGQEFTAANPESLTAGGYRVFVTLEPVNDNDLANPTQFELLSGTIAAGAASGTALPATNVASALPSADFVINR